MINNENQENDIAIATEELQKENKKPKKTYKKSATRPTKLSSEEYIKLLEEKIQLINFVNGLQLPDIPEGLSKTGRELLLGLLKDHTATIDKHIGLIQNL